MPKNQQGKSIGDAIIYIFREVTENIIGFGVLLWIVSGLFSCHVTVDDHKEKQGAAIPKPAPQTPCNSSYDVFHKATDKCSPAKN